jgi:beta-glucosidase-like glycosyl hydrolase
MSHTVLRKHWGFEGVIESDCGALGNIQSRHKYTTDGPSTAAAAMNGTCDVECDSVYR